MPQKPGVYLFLGNGDEILYVGKAKQLKNRVSSYFTQKHLLAPKTKLLVEQIKKIKIIIVESEFESLLLEANLIKKYSPKYNIRLVDGKAYPMIRITKRYPFPAVLTARKMDDEKSIYFGPFPSSTSMHTVIRILRRIFPFHSVINHPPKICLYYHLNLCPCIPAFPADENKKAYKKTIYRIIDFLNGKTKKVLKDLTAERDEMTRLENFEKAAILQNQINSIIYVTNPFHKPFEYETNPNLRTDLRKQELTELQEILQEKGVVIKFPSRIECFDISNIQGTNPTASMVVLTDGEIDKSQYRKFKIQTKGPNDFAMMEEVIKRRIKHKEWPYPDLLVVDGGKGQISSARKVLQENDLQIPLVGLAKREETIVTSDFKEIHLPKGSKALLVIMKIRDEAHRFAITFHKKLRTASAFKSLGLVHK